MVELLTPDVYVEEVPAGPRPIQAVGTRTARRSSGSAPKARRRRGEATAVNNWLAVHARVRRPDEREHRRSRTPSSASSRTAAAAASSSTPRTTTRSPAGRRRRAASARGGGRGRDRGRARLHRRGDLRRAADATARTSRTASRSSTGRSSVDDIERADAGRHGARPRPWPRRARAARRGRRPATTPEQKPGLRPRSRTAATAAFYFPGITIARPARRRRSSTSRHRATSPGIWARTDATRGRPQGAGQRARPRRAQRHPAADLRGAGRPQPGRRQLHPLLPARGHPRVGRADAGRRRERVALPQRPPPVQHDRGVDRRSDPLDRLRAQRPDALEVDPARRRRVPDPRLARRRAHGPDRRRGVLRQVRRGDQPARQSSTRASSSRSSASPRSSRPSSWSSASASTPVAWRSRRREAQVAEAAATPPEAARGGAQPGVWVDPYRAYNFKLGHPGRHRGPLRRVHRARRPRHRPSATRRAARTIVHRIPGPIDYGDVTLRYGLTASTRAVGLVHDRRRGPGRATQRLGADARHGRHDRGAALGPHQRLAVGVARRPARRARPRGRHRERDPRLRVPAARLSHGPRATPGRRPRRRRGRARQRHHRPDRDRRRATG